MDATPRRGMEATSEKPPCCAPDAPDRHHGGPTISIAAGEGAGSTNEMASLAGGTFLIGSDDRWAYPADGEAPARPVSIGPYWIDRHAVSNARFGQFAEAMGYVTEAERYGWSFVFAGMLPDHFPPTHGVAQAPWWRKVEGANWRHPEGQQSSIGDRPDHPVVHVSWNDSRAYCAWAGKRLPTEAEWEFAARGRLEGKVFPWGDELEPGGEHRMNVWQGTFPSVNTRADGHYGTCRVDAFPSNGFGLHNTTGNVWEWTADWFDSSGRLRDRANDALGPSEGTHRIQKGGSYLCHHSYCRRYRVAARQGSTPASSTANAGFRCARDA